MINPNDLEVVHVMHRKTDNIDNERVDFYFVAKKWEGEPRNMEEDKCDDLKWFPITKLPRNTISCVRQAIENYQKNIFYSEFGW